MFHFEHLLPMLTFPLCFFLNGFLNLEPFPGSGEPADECGEEKKTNVFARGLRESGKDPTRRIHVFMAYLPTFG